MNLLLTLLLALLLIILLRNLVTWLLKAEESKAKPDEAQRGSKKWLRKAAEWLRQKASYAVPAISVLLALGFSFVVSELAHVERPTYATPPSSDSNFFEAGLVPGIADIQRVISEGGISDTNKKDLANAVNKLKAHILEVTYQKTRSLEETHFTVEAWTEDLWIDGGFYIARSIIELKRTSPGGPGFLLPIIPKMEAEAKPRDSGYLRIGKNGTRVPLRSYVAPIFLGDLGRLQVFRVPIESSDVDSREKVVLEVTISAEQDYAFTMYALNTGPYRGGVGTVDVSLHFDKQNIFAWWPGVFDTAKGEVAFGKAPKSSPWKLSHEEFDRVEIHDGVITELPGTASDRDVLRFHQDGLFGPISPPIVGYWQ